MKPYTLNLLPRLQEYRDPEFQVLNRMEVRNYFPDAEEEQIDDLFEYFEDENQNNAEPILTIANIIQVLEEEFNDGTVSVKFVH